MKPFTTIAVIVFTLMALLHLYRFVRGLEIVVEGMPVPQWASLVGMTVAALLAFMIRREARRN
jgi:hypothetical protein